MAPFPVSVCVFFLALLSSPSCTPLLSTYAACVALCVRTVCTVPLIDSVHGETFTFEPQGGGDSNGFARGAWDWSMLWKRIPLGAREHKLRKTQTEPYRYTQSFLTRVDVSRSFLTGLTVGVEQPHLNRKC